MIKCLLESSNRITEIISVLVIETGDVYLSATF